MSCRKTIKKELEEMKKSEKAFKYTGPNWKKKKQKLEEMLEMSEFLIKFEYYRRIGYILLPIFIIPVTILLLWLATILASL